MAKIILGQSQSGTSNASVKLDLDILIPSRLLITANSGGGKSYTMRRLIEQAFGKVQIIVIDPEGEFATLREKFGFVLAGKGGDTPTDTRSAELLALKLLELRASCVCDLYEMKSRDRHEWVRLFLEALINAPKKLWHPCLVIIDEAHNYCPEKGAGESVALGAMVDFATKGRKRGFCAIWATQRLSKLNKDASAEMLNRLVGPTFEDVDRERAAKLLSIAGDQKSAFMKEIQQLEPGSFYAIGRAISKERLLVKIGEVETTHPQIGTKYAATPPPPPDKILGLLPQLADLPKEAEERARTVSDLQLENRKLRQELRTAMSVAPRQPDDKDIQKAIQRALRQSDEQWKVKIAAAYKAMNKMKSGWTSVSNESQLLKVGLDALLTQMSKLSKLELPAPNERVPAFEIPITPLPKVEIVRPSRKASMQLAESNGNGDLKTPERRILNAIAWFESIGNQQPKQAAVAFVAGYTIGGGAFNNPRGALRTRGLIDYRGDRLVLTDSGRQHAESPDTPLTTAEMHKRVLELLPTPEQRLLRPLLEAYPESVENDELARRAEYEPGGGAFNNPRGRLRTLEIVDYPEKGKIRAADWLFVD